MSPREWTGGRRHCDAPRGAARLGSRSGWHVVNALPVSHQRPTNAGCDREHRPSVRECLAVSRAVAFVRRDNPSSDQKGLLPLNI